MAVLIEATTEESPLADLMQREIAIQVLSSALKAPLFSRPGSGGVGAIPMNGEDVDLLTDFYNFRAHAEVTRFLILNPFLSQLLFQLHQSIQDRFGTGVSVALEISRDPDSDWEQLLAVIETSMEPDEVLTRLDGVEDDCWLRLAAQAQGKLNLSFEII